MEKEKGRTKSGFEFEIDRSVIDMELLDELADMQENPALTGRVLARLLGKDQKRALYDHIRTEDGHVPIDKAAAELVDIFKAFENGKNF
jgi:hypothetical protein